MSSSRSTTPKMTGTKTSNTTRSQVKKNSTTPSRPSTRSSSNSRNASRSRSTPTLVDTSPLVQMQKNIAGKSNYDVELYLQKLLQEEKYRDASYLITSSTYLTSKYKTSDVIRLVLDTKQFDLAAELIREMQLESNQQLVTLYIKELTKAEKFQTAVQIAKEMVHNFGHTMEKSMNAPTQPSWSPQALIQAMLRAHHYRTALKFIREYELKDVFPPKELIIAMFNCEQWNDAISSIIEWRLFHEFPIESLIDNMMIHKQWPLAMKCANRLSSEQARQVKIDAIIREVASNGEFILALSYLKEYKLENRANEEEESLKITNHDLMKYVVNCMIAHEHFYKAIKYSIKFGLATHQTEYDISTIEGKANNTKYEVASLIRQAMTAGQYNVAKHYIKKLRLHDLLQKEMAEIDVQQKKNFIEFSKFIQTREAVINQPGYQEEWKILMQDLLQEPDEYVDGESVIVDVVISEVEEVFFKPESKEKKPVIASSNADTTSGKNVIKNPKHEGFDAETSQVLNKSTESLLESTEKLTFSEVYTMQALASSNNISKSNTVSVEKTLPLEEQNLTYSSPPCSNQKTSEIAQHGTGRWAASSSGSNPPPPAPQNIPGLSKHVHSTFNEQHMLGMNFQHNSQGQNYTSPAQSYSNPYYNYSTAQIPTHPQYGLQPNYPNGMPMPPHHTQLPQNANIQLHLHNMQQGNNNSGMSTSSTNASSGSADISALAMQFHAFNGISESKVPKESMPTGYNSNGFATFAPSPHSTTLPIPRPMAYGGHPSPYIDMPKAPTFTPSIGYSITRQKK